MSSINIQSNSNHEIILPHVSIRSVLGGTVIAMAIMLTLLVAGSALGLGVLDFENGVSMTATSWGVGIWLILSFLISLFAGSYVAGRTSENLSSFAGAVNGLIIWGLMTIFSFSTITSGLTNAAYTAGNIAEAVGSNIGVPNVGGLGVESMLDNIKVSVKDIENQIEEIEAPEVKSLVKKEYKNLKTEFVSLAKSTLMNPSNAKENFSEMKESVGNSMDKFKKVLDRDKIRSIVAQNSELSEQEIEETTDKWYDTVQSVSNKVETQVEEISDKAAAYAEDLKEDAVETADKIKNQVATAMLIFTVMLIAGFIISLVGGRSGVSAALAIRA